MNIFPKKEEIQEHLNNLKENGSNFNSDVTKQKLTSAINKMEFVKSGELLSTSKRSKSTKKKIKFNDSKKLKEHLY